MKPRQFKKLCKKVVQIAPTEFKHAWIDSDDPFPDYYLSQRYSKSTMTHLFVVGGELDYWGEATDPTPTYDIARERVLWEYGEPTTETIKDHYGNVIDDVQGRPRYKRRLTGREVISKLRLMAA